MQWIKTVKNGIFKTLVAIYLFLHDQWAIRIVHRKLIQEECVNQGEWGIKCSTLLFNMHSKNEYNNMIFDGVTLD